jgi:hypothetical protein
MSLLYQLQCPKCGKPTTLSLTGTCINRLKNGAFCGYSFTWLDPNSRNGKMGLVCNWLTNRLYSVGSTAAGVGGAAGG